MPNQLEKLKLKVDCTHRKQKKSKEIWRRFRKNRIALFGLIVITLFLIASILADFITPYEMATKQNIMKRLQGPSSQHIFGTDFVGRDVFARVVHGARYSLAIGIVTTLCSLLISLILGASAGYFSGIIDSIIMRSVDILSSVPTLLLAMTIVAALGANILNLFIAMTIAGIPAFVRIIRTSILNVVNQEYIEAAKACGTNNLRIICKHVLANAIGPIIVAATMNVSQMILNAATLSFIGLGFQPPTPEWGSMLSEAREFMRTAIYLMVFPGVAIILSTLSINLVGDGLRDALDPKLKN